LLGEQRKTALLIVAFAFGRVQCISSQTPFQTATTAQTVLPAGTTVPMRMTRSLSSKDTKLGDLVELEVKHDVKLGDLLVIARRTHAAATVVEVSPAHRGMHGGHLGLELKAVNTTTGDVIPLRATKTAQGGPTADQKVRSVMEGQIILSWLPLLSKGDEALLGKGTAIDGYVDGNVVLDPALLRARMAVLEAQNAAARMAARTGDATVHLYHDSRGLTEDIQLDGHRLVKLRPGRFFTLHLPPGNHTVRCKKGEASLDLKPDEEYYIKFDWETRFLSWQCEPSLVSSEQGEDDVFAFAAADGKDVFPH
jgi:hypothetical protein